LRSLLSNRSASERNRIFESLSSSRFVTHTYTHTLTHTHTNTHTHTYTHIHTHTHTHTHTAGHAQGPHCGKQANRARAQRTTHFARGQPPVLCQAVWCLPGPEFPVPAAGNACVFSLCLLFCCFFVKLYGGYQDWNSLYLLQVNACVFALSLVFLSFCVKLCGAYQDRNSLYLLQVNACVFASSLVLLLFCVVPTRTETPCTCCR